MQLVWQKQMPCNLDLTQYSPDVALTSETWFSDKRDNACISVNGYTLYCRDHMSSGKAGVCAYVSKDINDKCEVQRHHSSSSSSSSTLFAK